MEKRKSLKTQTGKKTFRVLMTSQGIRWDQIFCLVQKEDSQLILPHLILKKK